MKTIALRFADNYAPKEGTIKLHQEIINNIPANEKCPNCQNDMIVKFYKNVKVISCEKCKIMLY